MPSALPDWAIEMAWVSEDDVSLPSAAEGINVVLNRVRLAAFLSDFAEDRDVRDLLALDILGAAIGLPLSSTGAPGSIPALALRPFRIWEYTWLYKCLDLSAGGANVLDLGGSASHLSVLAAIAGCRVTSIDINPAFVQAAKECARSLDLDLLDARVGDMRDLSALPDGYFDVVMACSVLEHLTAQDQEVALREMARVLKPGGAVGLTFDFGTGAPGANEHLPPPHAPPPDAREALRRYLQGSLVQIGNAFSEDPIPGSLFRHESVSYSVASLFLGKPPMPAIQNPRCEAGESVLRHLTIREFPHRIYKHVSALVAAADSLRPGLEAQRGVGESDRIQLLAELDAHGSALSTIRGQLDIAFADMDKKEQRSIALEQVANERLAGMHEKDQAISKLVVELDARASALNDMRSQLDTALANMEDMARRASILEQAAGERLAGMHEKDQAISKLTVELDARASALNDMRSQLDTALAKTCQQHQQAAKLQQAMAELEQRANQLQGNLERLLADNSTLRQQNRVLQNEPLFGYLNRRLRGGGAGTGNKP